MDKRGFDSTTIKILTRAANMICIFVILECLVIIILPSAAAGYHFYDMVKESSIVQSPWLIIPIVFTALVVLSALFALYRNHKIQKILKAQQDKNILNMPLEQYGSDIKPTEETPAQDYGNHRYGTAMTQEALIKRLMDDNAAEIAKCASRARHALRAGKENEAWIFVDKKQELEVSRVSIKAEYAKIVNSRRSRASIGLKTRQKDEAEILAEKYAAAAQYTALAKERKNAVHTKASVDEELARIKKDMGM